MNIHRYTVTVLSREHGKLTFRTVATSHDSARAIVLKAEACPPSCIRRVSQGKRLN